jgi:hypothetical protein
MNAVLKGLVDDIATRLGKHPSGIYAMGEDPEKDLYTRLLSIWYIVADLDFSQADILFRDFEARRIAKAPQKVVVTTEPKALASVSEGINAVMRAHFECQSNDEKLRKIAEAQEALRQLTATILNSEGKGNGHRVGMHEQRV